MHIEGTILRGREFDPVEGRVVVEDGDIVAVEEAAVGSDAIGTALPSRNPATALAPSTSAATGT